MEIEKLIEKLRDAGWTNPGLTDKQSLEWDAATALEQLQAENDRLRRERDAAVDEIPKVCYYCKHRKGWKICDRFNGNSEAETCTHSQCRGSKED